MPSPLTINYPPTAGSPWSCLETLPGLIALPRVWQARLGAWFEPVNALILQPNPNPAQLLPCPRGCGLAHAIVGRPDGSLAATCYGDPNRPEDIPLTPDDITPLEVSWSKLGRALCQALGLRSRFGTLQPFNTIQFGAWSVDAVPAILTIQVCPAAFRRVVPELVARLQRPFILFAPTSNHFDASCLELLARVRAAFLSLDSTVLLGDDGRFRPARSPGELFAQFTPQPGGVDKDVAGGAMASVKTANVFAPAYEPKRSPDGGVAPAGVEGRLGYVFRRVGRLWEVIYGGGQPFYLEDTLGARYLGYLLHHPNQAISAFDLEVLIQPEKGESRTRDSIQPANDARACKEYRQALRRLQAQREKAQAAGDPREAGRLEEQIEALELALHEGTAGAHTGERARSNVRHALRAVRGQLKKDGWKARAFAEHLRTQVSTGYECLYLQPQGRIWD